MRRAWLLLLLTGCHRGENPEYIQSLLAQTPIPTDRLREILEIKPGELEIEGGPPHRALDTRSLPQWVLVNTSRRSLWVHLDELVVGQVWDVERRRSRPGFRKERWRLLRPGDRVPLRNDLLYNGEKVDFAVRVGWMGLSVFLDAAWSNDPSAAEPLDWRPALEGSLGESWILPALQWDGGTVFPGPYDPLEATYANGRFTVKERDPGAEPPRVEVNTTDRPSGANDAL